MQLKPDTLFSMFVIVLFILPGFFSQSIIQSLIKKNLSIDKSETTYLSLLHSLVIYIIVYPLIVLVWGVDIYQPETLKGMLFSSRWAPIIAVIILGLISLVWALLCTWVQKTRVVKVFQELFGMAVEPPNIYARMLNKAYRQGDEPDSYWITVQIGNRLVEGGVKYQVTNGEKREVYLTNVAYLDPETRELIERLPEGVGVIIDLDNRHLTEISFGSD